MPAHRPLTLYDTREETSMRPTPRPRRLIPWLLPVALAPGFAFGQAVKPAPAPKTDSPAEINKPFAHPDVKAFVERFEAEDREVFARRREIVGALGLKPGMAVADVGAGTGAFTRLIADRVGPKGKVYAVDVSREFLAHIKRESRKLGQAQVVTVPATQDSTGLAPGSIDLAFVCDVYHHLERPARSLASIRRALRPGGQLVVIDFDRVEGKSRAFVLKHVRAGKDVFAAEIRAAGFAPVPAPEAPPLKESFFLRFRRTDGPPAPVAPRLPAG
jgi:ubiquinone/menaquinone biosynthesis C-methylase UbiE